MAMKTTVCVEGMACAMCEKHVNEAICREFGVAETDVSSSHEKKTTVFFSSEAPDKEKVKAVIEATGFKVTSVTVEDAPEKGSNEGGGKKKKLFSFLGK